MVVSEVRSDIEGRMIRTDRYKYACYRESEHPETLFDLRQDPGEMHNLAYDPEHQDLLKEYRSKLAAWCKEMDDPFAVSVEFLKGG
jgi:choline-sulfatase